MDFHTAADTTIRSLQTDDRASADAEPVHTALALALYAWQQLPLADDETAAPWHRFGTDVHAAQAELAPPAPVTVVGVDRPTGDTAALRRQCARLATAAADRLDRAAHTPGGDVDRRLSWGLAAARLRTAAADLAPVPEAGVA